MRKMQSLRKASIILHVEKQDILKKKFIRETFYKGYGNFFVK